MHNVLLCLICGLTKVGHCPNWTVILFHYFQLSGFFRESETFCMHNKMAQKLSHNNAEFANSVSVSITRYKLEWASFQKNQIFNISDLMLGSTCWKINDRIFKINEFSEISKTLKRTLLQGLLCIATTWARTLGQGINKLFRKFYF